MLSTIVHLCQATIPNGWLLPPITLSNYLPNTNMSDATLSMQMDSQGNALACWVDTDISGNHSIAIARYQTNDNGWQTSIKTIGETDITVIKNTMLAMNNAGDAFIIWQVYNNLYATKFPRGTDWTSWISYVVTLTNNADPEIESFFMSNNESGDALFMYSSGTTFRSVFYDHTIEWNSWSPTEVDTTIHQLAYPILYENGNAFTLIYDFTVSTTGAIFAAQYLNTPTPEWTTTTTPLNLLGAPNGNSYPVLALDPVSQKTFAVWNELNISYTPVYVEATQYDPATWPNFTTITLATSLDNYEVDAFNEVIDASGNVTFMWNENNDNSPYNGLLQTTYFDHTITWSTWIPASATTLVNSSTNMANWTLGVQPTSNTVFALWETYNGTSYSVQANQALDGVWTGSQNVTLLGNNRAATPQIGLAANGNAVAIWGQVAQQAISAAPFFETVSTFVNALWYNATTKLWQNKTTPVSNSSPIYGGYQILAVNPAGNTLLAWEQSLDRSSDNNIVQATNAIFLGTPPTQRITLEAGKNNKILMDAAGNAFVFIQNGSSLTQCTHKVTDPIGIWTCSTISTTVSQYSADSNLNGSIVVGYTDIDNTLYGQYNGNTSVITSDVCSIQAAISSGAENPALAFLGNCLSTRASSSTNGQVIVATFDGTEWVLSPTLSSLGASDPQVQIDSNFNVIVIWQIPYDETNSKIQAAIGVPTQTPPYGWDWDWSGPITDLTPSYSNANATDPQLAIDQSGNAIAIWEFTDGSITNTVIQASRHIYNDDNTWTDLTTLSSSDSSASQATISMDNAGNATVVWLIPYFNGTSTVTRVQGTYFNATTDQWQAISITPGPNTSYFSPDNGYADYPCTSLGTNGLGLVTYILSGSSVAPNNLYGNIIDPSNGIIDPSTNLSQTSSDYQEVSCAINSTNLLGIITNNLTAPDTLVILSAGQSFFYNLVQWGSAFGGNQKYLLAINANTPSLDMYLYDPTSTSSLSYLQTLNLSTETSSINDVAVYNKDDNHIYIAIAAPNLVQIQLWNGSQFQVLDTLDTNTATVTTLSWWVDTTNPSYAAYLAIADTNNYVTIYGLDNNFNFSSPLSSHLVGSSPFTSMLWYVKTDGMGNMTLLDLIGGSTQDSYEYTITVSLTTKLITDVTQNVLPYPMGGLSTCDAFLAIGDYGAPTGTGAAVTLYDVDNITGSIQATDSIISDTAATHVYYLAKCCAAIPGSPEYLLAGVGDGTQYTVYVYNPVNLETITQQSLGNLATSVAWCSNGYNDYLAVTYKDSADNQAGEIFQLNTTATEPLIDLGPIAYS